MCGISGYISNKELVHENAINNTLKLMSRRGPDAQKFLKTQIGKKEISLIHSRLSIIDIFGSKFFIVSSWYELNSTT